MNKFARIVAAPAAVLATIGSANAAVPAGVTQAMTDMGADSITVATAFLIAAIALTAFLFMRKGAR